jgi:uncharacterized damage-inducible protein DinB
LDIPSIGLIGEFTEFHWRSRAARLIPGCFSGGKVTRFKPPYYLQERNMLARYRMFAGYNAWCNERLYDTATLVPDADYRADRGAFFNSLHGTLNHLLVGDRIWMRRFTGQGDVPPSLDAILYDDFVQLRAARRAEDALISGFIGSLREDDLANAIRYRTVVNPQDIEQTLAPALDHFFNHQTHHRGQAHALLSAAIGNDRTPSFDLIIYQRETGQGGLRKIG